MNISAFSRNPMGENCYAVTLEEQALLVDPGFYTKDLAAFLEEWGPRVCYVLLTHCHFDHILALPQVLSHCPNVKIVIHQADAAGLWDPELSLSGSFRRRCPQQPLSADIVLQNETETLPFGSTEIGFLHTPGHTAGSVCYLLKENMFSGDTLFPLSCGRTDLPSGSPVQMAASLRRLRDLPVNYTVYPGHNEKTTLFFEKNNNREMLA